MANNYNPPPSSTTIMLHNYAPHKPDSKLNKITSITSALTKKITPCKKLFPNQVEMKIRSIFKW